MQVRDDRNIPPASHHPITSPQRRLGMETNHPLTPTPTAPRHHVSGVIMDMHTHLLRASVDLLVGFIGRCGGVEKEEVGKKKGVGGGKVGRGTRKREREGEVGEGIGGRNRRKE